MAKKRKTKQNPPFTVAGKEPTRAGSSGSVDKKRDDSDKWIREAVESIVIAVLLALLFRGFEAEAFIIPTGSMAPTLQGRHKDVRCPQCRYSYRVGATQELETGRPIVGTTCPICGLELTINPEKSNQAAFNGDRILVNKFIYEFTDPQRWDVIVFKYPGNAKQNYIKRLVGLPGESLEIASGDVYVQRPGESQYGIARKPTDKLPHMLHLVHDTRYIPEPLVAAKWPSRWHDPSDEWSISKDQKTYALESPTGEIQWLRYRHIPPTAREWKNFILKGKLPRKAPRPQLISDHYAYNTFRLKDTDLTDTRDLAETGWHWVGDLALEASIHITQPDGQLWLELVEGGNRLTCGIDVRTGEAELRINHGDMKFAGVDGDAPPEVLTARTPIRGSGRYHVMWANVDNRVTLWVNRRVVPLTAGDKPHPGEFSFPRLLKPQWSESNPGDLLPVAVGGQGLEMTVSDLKVLRDIYYVAARPGRSSCDYQSFSSIRSDRPDLMTANRRLVQSIFQQPEKWNSTWLFDDRETTLRFELDDDLFFPMGDNSPQSKDARLWHVDNQIGADFEVKNGVERRYLIGKAFLVYWPHGWNPGNVKLPVIPNLDRMGRIR